MPQCSSNQAGVIATNNTIVERICQNPVVSTPLSKVRFCFGTLIDSGGGLKMVYPKMDGFPTSPFMCPLKSSGNWPNVQKYPYPGNYIPLNFPFLAFTLPKTDRSHLKMMMSNRVSFSKAPFSGVFAVSFRGEVLGGSSQLVSGWDHPLL